MYCGCGRSCKSDDSDSGGSGNDTVDTAKTILRLNQPSIYNNHKHFKFVVFLFLICKISYNNIQTIKNE